MLKYGMNLSELEITRRLKNIRGNNMIGSQLQDVVYAHGWKLLGRGSEASVAEHPQKGYVLKIWPTNSLYTKFVEMVQKHPSPHFPRFSKIMKQIPGTRFNYVRMEKLAKITEYDILIEMPECFCALKELFTKTRIPPPHFIETNMKKVECSRLSPAAQQAINLMAAQVQKIGPRLDLHPANIMRRGSTWVITDPYYG